MAKKLPLRLALKEQTGSLLAMERAPAEHKFEVRVGGDLKIGKTYPLPRKLKWLLC